MTQTRDDISERRELTTKDLKGFEMNWTVKELLSSLSEAKQVGTIYHFTTVKNLHDMMNQSHPFVLGSQNQENISLSRNRHLGVNPPNQHFKSTIARIALDGDKMSEHHKIKPLLGLADASNDVFNHKHTNRVSRHSGEAEEVVLRHPLDIKPYIKHIHVIRHPSTEKYVDEHIIPKLKEMNIPHNHEKSYNHDYNMKEDERDLYLNSSSMFQLV